MEYCLNTFKTHLPGNHIIAWKLAPECFQTVRGYTPSSRTPVLLQIRHNWIFLSTNKQEQNKVHLREANIQLSRFVNFSSGCTSVCPHSPQTSQLYDSLVSLVCLRSLHSQKIANHFQIFISHPEFRNL